MTATLGPALPDEVERLARSALRRAWSLRMSLATAESCTGGLLASILTDVDGLGRAFDRGFIVYTDAAKREMLGVAAELLERCGAVSEPAARAMADGALARSEAGMAIAVTGYAGPAGPGEPQGLVHFALAERDRPTRHRREEFGPVGRGEGRIACLRVALVMLDEALTAAGAR